MFRQNTGYYENLEVGNKYIAKQIDDILSVLADVMLLNDEEEIKINQNKMKASVVKVRFLQLDSSHLEYLRMILDKHNEKVRNIRAFILTVAFNVVTNIDAYYSNLVSYDMRNTW